MSEENNEMWLENAKENFEEAVETENWGLCRALISDVRDMKPDSAVTMERLLSEAQNDHEQQ